MKVTAARKERKEYYGMYGGRRVPARLKDDLIRLEQMFDICLEDRAFKEKLEELRAHYAGRPTPLYFAKNTTKKLGGGRLYLKMEGLSHAGAHRINNALGQGLLAARLGKKKLIAGTVSGQHGIAAATVAAALGLKCDVYMGEEDARRQRPNVFYMETLGARVIPVRRDASALTEAADAAFQAWSEEHGSALYLAGCALAPSPYPRIVREFLSFIGQEVREQSLQRFGGLPDILIAGAEGETNPMGLFAPFIDESPVRLIAAEGEADISPELSFFHNKGRVELTNAPDEEVRKAIPYFARNEGIIPAQESAHALAAALKIIPELSVEQCVVVNVSCRSVLRDLPREEYQRLCGGQSA